MERTSPTENLEKRCEALGLQYAAGCMGQYSKGGHCIRYPINSELGEAYFKTIKQADNFLALYQSANKKEH